MRTTKLSPSFIFVSILGVLAVSVIAAPQARDGASGMFQKLYYTSTNKQIRLNKEKQVLLYLLSPHRPAMQAREGLVPNRLALFPQKYHHIPNWMSPNEGL